MYHAHTGTWITTMVAATALTVGCGGDRYNTANSGAAGSGGLSAAGSNGGNIGDGTGGAAGVGSGGMSASLTPVVDPSVDGHLTINELMAANVLTTRDDQGNVSGWFELYNPTMQDISLAGYRLTDDPSVPAKVVLQAGSMIRGGGYLVFWCDGNPSAGPAHVAISLAETGGALTLERPDGSLIERLVYGAQEVDLSAAREPDGSDKWVAEWHPSVGTANPDAGGKPVAPQAASDPPEMVPAAGDVSERILGYDLNPKFELQISDPNIAALKAQPANWVQATLVYDGRSYGPVGVNLKGMRSFAPIDQKPAFHVKIDKFTKRARFFGLRELTLNNMHTDLSMMHERIAYWLARQVGVPASRANHAMLTVNGQMYGLYANIETPREEFLARWFPDPSGSLYGIQYVDFVAQYLSLFQLQVGPEDRSLISALSSDLTLGSPDAAMIAAAQHANIHEFNRYWALCAVIGQFDSSWPYAAQGESVGGDALVYSDPKTKRLWFLPEGVDDTFDTADFDFTKVHSIVPQTCEASPACYQDFISQVWEILGKAEQLDWAAERDRVAAQIATLVPMDDRKPYTNADVAMGQMQMGYFISGRRHYLAKFIPLQ